MRGLIDLLERCCFFGSRTWLFSGS